MGTNFSTTSIGNIALIRLCFSTQKDISLPWYHGAVWNAVFRDLIRKFLNPKIAMADMGFRIHPLDTGVLYYDKGDPVHIDVSFPFSLLSHFEQLLDQFNSLTGKTGAINPSTVHLNHAICRVTGKRFHPGQQPDYHAWAKPITQSLVTEQAKILTTLDEFSIIFFAPLRLKSPASYKKETTYTYIDPNFFVSHAKAFEHLLTAAGVPQNQTEQNITLTQSNLLWQDMIYGKNKKSIGGILGKIRFAGKLTPVQAQCLSASQYTGLGKNNSFGFGFFQIQELAASKALLPSQRGRPLIHKIFAIPSLEYALKRLPNSSPGPDELTISDIKQAGKPFLKKLSTTMIHNDYIPGPWKLYRRKKTDKNFRPITVFNVQDRIVHRTLADFCAALAEKLLSKASFAYRQGKNRNMAVKQLITSMKKGYKSGIRFDISNFFASVDIKILCASLQALLPFDPLPVLIQHILEDMNTRGIHGLPQGSPLSPVLSNIYLDRFDKQILSLGIRLFRYGDDCVALSDALSFKELKNEIISALSVLGLNLNHEKTRQLDPLVSFTFLGFSIEGTQVAHISATSSDSVKLPVDTWLPVFREQVIKGQPVYLTTLCRGAYSNGPYMIIQEDQGGKAQIPWHGISRIVVSGRSSFSSGIVYQAVKRDIPVSFVDILGYSTGHLTSACSEVFTNEKIQDNMFLDPEFSLHLARQIISAKIHNTHVLLRRNHSPVNVLKGLSKKAAAAESMEQLRGFEGSAARMYFKTLSSLVHPFIFEKRVFHPPDSPVNAMLSFGYTLLYNRTASALRENGLNPYKGFFHRTGGRHFALASDLMEELRHIIDRIVLSLIHRKEITPDDFDTIGISSRSACRLSGNGFRKFIRRYENIMASEIQYAGPARISYNAYLDEMAQNLIRTMKLDIPFPSLRIR